MNRFLEILILIYHYTRNRGNVKGKIWGGPGVARRVHGVIRAEGRGPRDGTGTGMQDAKYKIQNFGCGCAAIINDSDNGMLRRPVFFVGRSCSTAPQCRSVHLLFSENRRSKPVSGNRTGLKSPVARHLSAVPGICYFPKTIVQNPSPETGPGSDRNVF